jgi:hypothetical protein
VFLIYDNGGMADGEYAGDEDAEAISSETKVFEYHKHGVNVKLFAHPQNPALVEIQTWLNSENKIVNALERVNGFMLSHRTNAYCVAPKNAYEFAVICKEEDGSTSGTRTLWSLLDSHEAAHECWQQLEKWATSVSPKYTMICQI